MGSCATVHKDDVGLPKKQLLASSPPPSKDTKAVDGAPLGDVLVDLKRKIEGFGPSRTPDSGSKDEMFFESQPWLDSDCEDDFYSINGDFTPSRGSTPVHQPRAQTVMSNVFLPDNAAHSPNSSEASPTGRRKLADLLQEATRNDTGEAAAAAAAAEPDSSKSGQQAVAPAAGKSVSEPSSGCSTEPTPVREARIRKERAWYSGRCCLPTFVHSLAALDDEGRQKTGPGPCAV
uniref:Predicted protein n=1 Tax=Hordeum vulgare subsp. vulgare TaxID=112509 RepID=F2D1Y1_HORVV|nr:predicted protein [Hordeum vulgare subsp. vulgare]